MAVAGSWCAYRSMIACVFILKRRQYSRLGSLYDAFTHPIAWSAPSKPGGYIRTGARLVSGKKAFLDASLFRSARYMCGPEGEY